MPSVITSAGGPLLVAIDAGTSSVRALAFDSSGRAHAASESQIRYQLHTTPDGGATFPAKDLFDLTCAALQGVDQHLRAHRFDIAAVGTTSFWHSLLGIDENGKPTTPVYYWADTRSAQEAAALRKELDGAAVWQRTGCRLHSSYWPAKLRWLRRTEPRAFARTARWLSFAEFALARLAGAAAGAATFCMASGTGLLDVHKLAWDEELLAACGISPDRLSPLVNLGPPGQLEPEFAGRLRAFRDAEWFPALGDGACANVGAAAVGSRRMALTVGTSAAIRMILPRAADAEWTIPAGLWAYRLDRDHAVFGGALSNGGNLLRWIMDTTGTSDDDAAAAAAVTLSPDASGLTLLPFLAGERSPGWYDDASAVVAGLTLSTRPADLIRAGMEAVAYRLAEVYDAISSLAAPEHEIVVNGGAVVDRPGWLQIVADTLGRPLVALPAGDESTARGAALVAGVACGLLSSLADAADIAAEGTTYLPDQARHERYRAGRERQRRLEQLVIGTEFV